MKLYTLSSNVSCDGSAPGHPALNRALSGLGVWWEPVIFRDYRWGGSPSSRPDKTMLSSAHSSSQTPPYGHFQAVINQTLKITSALRSNSWVIGAPRGSRQRNFGIRVIWSVLRAVCRSASLPNEWDVKRVPGAQEKAEGGFLGLSQSQSINPVHAIVCQYVTNTYMIQSITKLSAKH